jgi:hypothetical protein
MDVAHHEQIVTEAQRILGRAGTQGLPLRLIGGVAVRLRAGDAYPAALARPYADLDFVTSRGAARDTEAFLEAEGYEPYHAFNVLHGTKRLLFFDTERNRQVDIFVGAFTMCHEIPTEERLELEPLTPPLAELLLTKLQIVQLNEKDVIDTLALLATHEVGDGDGDMLNASRVANLCASDWGLWRTITGNLGVVVGHIGEYALDAAERAAVERRIEALLARIDAEPKGRAWRLRARIGERIRWYELPEEVEQGT